MCPASPLTSFRCGLLSCHRVQIPHLHAISESPSALCILSSPPERNIHHALHMLECDHQSNHVSEKSPSILRYRSASTTYNINRFKFYSSLISSNVVVIIIYRSPSSPVCQCTCKKRGCRLRLLVGYLPFGRQTRSFRSTCVLTVPLPFPPPPPSTSLPNLSFCSPRQPEWKLEKGRAAPLDPRLMRVQSSTVPSIGSPELHSPPVRCSSTD